MKVALGLLIAQIGIPIGMIFIAIINGMIPFDQGAELFASSLLAVAFTSIFGLIITIPTSLICGIPTYYVLKRYDVLNIFSILGVGLMVCISVNFLLAGFDLQSLIISLPMALFTSLIFWFYLRLTGALTK